jgi:hypothetical protein
VSPRRRPGARPAPCACTTPAAAAGRSFDPARRPAEWTEVGTELNRSQFHSDYGEITYRCEVCASLIRVSFLERETETCYRIESLTPAPRA